MYDKGVYQHLNVTRKRWLTAKSWSTPGENVWWEERLNDKVELENIIMKLGELKLLL